MSNSAAALILVAMLGALGGCGGRSAKDTTTPVGPVSSKREFAQMRQDLNLTPDQEVAFSARVAAREAALRAWNDGPDGKRLAAARSERTAATDPIQRAQLDAELTRLNESQWKVRSTYRAEVLQVLTADQQQRWAGARLGERLLNVYARLGLDDAQQVRVRAIADEAVALDLAPGEVVRDPYLATVLEPARLAATLRIEAEVLTAAQQAVLAQPREQPTVPAKPQP